jgi:hypothetical protein
MATKPVSAPAAEPVAGGEGGPAPAAARRPAWPARLALAAIVVAGLALRLRNIDHGLPWVYHADEALHFTNRAVGMLRGSLDPHYFQNPSAFTYLVYALVRVRFGLESAQHLLARYAADPTSIYVTARVLAAVLCMVGVGVVYAVGRRLFGAGAGLAAAAILAFAFLPVAYSRFALTDVGVFAPAALAVYAAVAIHEDGRRRWFVVGGAAIGLAVGFKYTAGLLVAPLLVAAWLRSRTGAAVLRDTAIALGLAAVVFAITTPFFFLDLHGALYQLKVEAKSAANPKFGPAKSGPLAFYLWTLTWGLGWAASIAAAAGIAVLARASRTRAVLLALFPLLLLLYISTAGRYFARWLMPAYPVLALLAGLALARAAALVPARPLVRAGALTALVAVVLAQPLAADLHVTSLMGRTDTRELARDYLAGSLPAGTKVVVEPAVPRGWVPRDLREGFGPPPRRGNGTTGSPTRFINDLSARRIDRYRAAGYCTVVSMSLIRDRALARPSPRIEAYYRRLTRESRVLFHASPYKPGARPVPFDFDFSTHLYYPGAYQRPGPDVTIYRLRGCGPGSAAGAGGR